MPNLSLRRLLGSPSASRSNKKAPAYRPRLEPLEDRLLPSGFGGEDESATEAATDGLTVVSYNVGAGSHLAPLVAAATPQALPGAMSQVWGEVWASNIPGRAVALAHEIAHGGADVVGLQGAALWTVNGRTGFDFLALLRHDLRARGQQFIVAAVAPTGVVALPDAAGNLIGCIDRTVILVNARLFGEGFEIERPTTAAFAAHSDLHIGGPQGMVLPSLGSWACVDLVNTVDGDHTFRFVTARLDGQDPGVAAEQAGELLAGPAQARVQAAITGDFGFPAGSTAYKEMLQVGGFYDTWMRRNAGQPGLTSGEPSLADPVRALQARTDFIFIRDGFTVGPVALLGTLPGDRAPSGLWPSDHAGLLNDLVLI